MGCYISIHDSAVVSNREAARAGNNEWYAEVDWTTTFTCPNGLQLAYNGALARGNQYQYYCEGDPTIPTATFDNILEVTLPLTCVDDETFPPTQVPTSVPSGSPTALLSQAPTTAAPTLVPTISLGYCKKYTMRWPHCENIGDCFTGVDQAVLEEACNDLGDQCDGFSYSNPTKLTLIEAGSGCLKSCREDESFNGYGDYTHDYWEKINPN